MDDGTSERGGAAAVKRPFIGAVIALVAGLAVFFGLNAYKNRPANIDAQFEQGMATAPGMAPLFQAFKSEFPSEYAAFKAEMIAKYKNGADREAGRLAGFTWMRAFSTRHLGDVALAPSANLREFREAQEKVLAVLGAESVTLCAHFGMDGLHPGDRPGPAGLDAVGNAGAAMLRAAAAGIKTPTKRGEPSPQDTERLFANMTALGLTPGQRAAFVSPSGPTGASAEDQCTIGKILYKAIGQLPEPAADRITAALVRSMSGG